MTDSIDYRDTVFLPKTDFPMKAGLPQKEPGILARWENERLYQKLRDKRRGREKFILHDGPPYANGDMHIGHAMQRILKDMVVRTQSLLGKDAPFVPGWDCHGLPIEWKVEEEYRKKKLNKDEVPVKEFRAECRAYAQNWVNIQRDQIKRLGAIGDWDNPYLTMDFAAEATIVSELMKFAESGQLYRGAKPVMWSPVEKTALAEAEVEYEDVVSTQVDVAFEITHCPKVPELVGAYAVIWTTTPWTIPVNQAIAYGADVEYVLIETSPLIVTFEEGETLPKWNGIQLNGRRFVVAANLVSEFIARLEKQGYGDTSLPSSIGAKTLSSFKGSDLAGTTARHPMAKLFEPSPLQGRGGSRVAAEGEGAVDGPQTRTAPSPSLSPEGERDSIALDSPLAEFFLRPRPFLPGTFVTTETGTGLVHMAPDHGEDDFDLCKAHGIEPVFAVEGDGKYRADWAWLGGQGSVINPKFNAPDGPICSDLRAAGGLLAASADYQHSYPHSWRSKAKVIYRCTPQWFVPMDRALSTGDCPSLGTVPESLGPTDGARDLGTVPEGGTVPLATLRSTALAAIKATRWVPEKGENRIRSMVESRPDWVLSRQRAWGVPITLFVDRKTGHYLCDAQVNARIVEAIKAEGVDAWCDENAQAFLGDAYRAEDYEQVFDILDVWFDSGCTHVFTLESGKWPELSWPADLYLEGSDQHRGWFQSSLLESCGTRGRAPYKAVLTHGFTMDAKGMKMSKSLGNTIDPLKVMETNGADIIRLWALSVDFTEDHRIGDEILKGVSDQYRKLRNTFRYLLGALEGFSEDEKVPVADMPELERYMLHLLADMDGKLRVAVDDFDFNSYVRLLADFANEDLSAFFFDIRKDSLYCDAVTSPKRRAYRTVLDILFHAMVRYAAPVLVFTAEEVWQTRFPDDGESVHFLEWPEVPDSSSSYEQFDSPSAMAAIRSAHWDAVRRGREAVLAEIEPKRREKILGSSLEAQVTYPFGGLGLTAEEFGEICIVSDMLEGPPSISKTTRHKCGRCWRHLPEVTEDGSLCGRCKDVVNV